MKRTYVDCVIIPEKREAGWVSQEKLGSWTGHFVTMFVS